MIEQIIKQLDPRSAYLLMIAILVLISLASYFYIFKASWITIAKEQDLLFQLQDENRNNPPLTGNIDQLHERIASLKQELEGNVSELQDNQLESHIIKQLDQIAYGHAVKLGGVKPGNKREILMFSELPFHVDVAGRYEDLYSWLNEVESKLGPLVVKRFDIRSRPNEIGVQSMHLTIVSYRYKG